MSLLDEDVCAQGIPGNQPRLLREREPSWQRRERLDSRVSPPNSWAYFPKPRV